MTLTTSKKFWLTVAAIIGATVLTFNGAISPDKWLEFTKWALAFYMGGNALEHVAGAVKAIRVNGTSDGPAK